MERRNLRISDFKTVCLRNSSCAKINGSAMQVQFQNQHERNISKTAEYDNAPNFDENI